MRQCDETVWAGVTLSGLSTQALGGPGSKGQDERLNSALHRQNHCDRPWLSSSFIYKSALPSQWLSAVLTSTVKVSCVCVCVGNSNLCAVHVGSVLRMGCSGVSVFLALINCYYTLTNNTETKLLILNRFTGSIRLNSLIFYWFKPVNAFHLCSCSFSGCHRDRLV